MTGRAIDSRVQRWLDENRLLDRIFDWLYDLDGRRSNRKARYVREDRAKARAER